MGAAPQLISSSRDAANRYILFPARRDNIVLQKVIFADFSKSADRPTGELVYLELLPKEPGEYEFTCGMSMFRGKLSIRLYGHFIGLYSMINTAAP